VWQYIQREQMGLPKIYFAHERDRRHARRNVLGDRAVRGTGEGEIVEHLSVRFRTVGDANCTGAVRSSAATLEAIIDEVALANVSDAARRAPTTSSPRPPWKIENAKGTSKRGTRHKDLLRLATIGSVDDGKSTLIDGSWSTRASSSTTSSTPSPRLRGNAASATSTSVS